MLAYYQEGYKTKFAECIKSGEKEFFDEIASTVTKQLDFYIQHNWFQIHGIAKLFQPTIVATDETGDESVTPVKIYGVLTTLIGEFIGSDVSWEAESSAE